MSTILEIQDKRITYCQEYDSHCLCPKCSMRCLTCEECKSLKKLNENEKKKLFLTQGIVMGAIQKCPTFDAINEINEI